MATVKITKKQQRYAHFGLYKTAVGGDEQVIIRRKVGEPTDFMHKNSRPLRRQRVNMGLASQHWSNLTQTQKQYWRNQLAFTTRQGSPSTEQLLRGRQLFIAQELYSLLASGAQILAPNEYCIILCDPMLNPLAGELHLYYQENGLWVQRDAFEISQGNWLFPSVPQQKLFYRVEGAAPYYIDPKLPETQFMLEEALKLYHYHILQPAGELLLMELWTIPPELGFELLMAEPWAQAEPPELEYLLTEMWQYIEDIEFELLFTELWHETLVEIEFELLFTELWHETLPVINWLKLATERWDAPEFQQGPTNLMILKIRERWTR